MIADDVITSIFTGDRVTDELCLTGLSYVIAVRYAYAMVWEYPADAHDVFKALKHYYTYHNDDRIKDLMDKIASLVQIQPFRFDLPHVIEALKDADTG